MITFIRYQFSACYSDLVQIPGDITKNQVRYCRFDPPRLFNGSVGVNFALRRTQNLLRGTCSENGHGANESGPSVSHTCQGTTHVRVNLKVGPVS